MPFRSPRLADLAAKRESFEFASKLWSGLLRQVEPELAICIDRETASRVGKIIRESLDGQLVSAQAIPTGWGRVSADVQHFSRGGRSGLTLIRLPHLSTYQLFSSARCAEATERILRLGCGGLRL